MRNFLRRHLKINPFLFPNSLSNQVALVTRGSRGMGRAICRALDAEGADPKRSSRPGRRVTNRLAAKSADRRWI